MNILEFNFAGNNTLCYVDIDKVNFIDASTQDGAGVLWQSPGLTLGPFDARDIAVPVNKTLEEIFKIYPFLLDDFVICHRFHGQNLKKKIAFRPESFLNALRYTKDEVLVNGLEVIAHNGNSIGIRTVETPQEIAEKIKEFHIKKNSKNLSVLNLPTT